jgi:hypothetical protein
MTSTEHDNNADPASFMAAWEAEIDRQLLARHGWVVLGLTNFGERPVTTTRLAGVLGIPVSDADALARQRSWPGTRVEDGIITVSPERARSATRRHLQIGNRRFGVTGCGPDIFLYAPLVRPLASAGGNLHGDRNTHPHHVHTQRYRQCRTRRSRSADAPPADT